MCIIESTKARDIHSSERLVAEIERSVCRPVHRGPPTRYLRLAKPCRFRVDNEPESCCRRQEQASIESSEPFDGTSRTQKNAKRTVATDSGPHTPKTHTAARCRFVLYLSIYLCMYTLVDTNFSVRPRVNLPLCGGLRAMFLAPRRYAPRVLNFSAFNCSQKS